MILIKKIVLNYILYSELKLSQNILLHLRTINSPVFTPGWQVFTLWIFDLTHFSIIRRFNIQVLHYMQKIMLIIIIHSLIHTFKQRLNCVPAHKELKFRFSSYILSIHHLIGIELNTLCRHWSHARYWASYFKELSHLFITTSAVGTSIFLLQIANWDSEKLSDLSKVI